MSKKMIPIAIVDEHTLLRKFLNDFLSAQENIKVIFEASNMPDLMGRLRTLSVDVLLINIMTPESFDHHSIKEIRSSYPGIKILILSMSTDLEFIVSLLDCGIHGYVSKMEEPDELLRAIRSVSENRIYRNKLFTDALYWDKQHTIQSDTADPVLLSEREKGILQLLWEEKSNKEIADHFYLSIRSIEKIRQDMKEKLGVKSTVGLIKYAIKNKLLGNIVLQGNDPGKRG